MTDLVCMCYESGIITEVNEIEITKNPPENNSVVCMMLHKF